MKTRLSYGSCGPVVQFMCSHWPNFFFQSSDAASLHALELLMNEFFDSSTNNHRKREIGIVVHLSIIMIMIIYM